MFTLNAPRDNDSFFEVTIKRVQQNSGESYKEFLARRSSHYRDVEAKIKEAGLTLSRHVFYKSNPETKADAEAKANADRDQITAAIGPVVEVCLGSSL